LSVWGFVFGNWLTLLFLTVPIIGAFLWRIRIEESALTEALGGITGPICGGQSG